MKGIFWKDAGFVSPSLRKYYASRLLHANIKNLTKTWASKCHPINIVYFFVFIMLDNCLRHIVFLLIAASTLSGCGPTTATQFAEKFDAERFSPEQILQLVSGNTMLFVSFHEDSYFYFDRSGRVYGIDIYQNKDIGKWDVADTGELCMKLEHWWSSYQKCFFVYSDGEKYALTDSSGVIAFNARHFEGDFKNQYYVPKEKRKSYRRSILKDQSAQSQETAQNVHQEPAPQPDKETPLEQSAPSYTTSDAELKSTVKWMAKDCPGCNLANTNLKKADLVGAKLQGTNLSGANLSMADMRRADLSDANLAGADLTFANMPGAVLRNCNLRNANFKGANLIRADLTGADLEGAIFEDALLEGVQGMK